MTDNETLRRIAELEYQVQHIYNVLKVDPPPGREAGLSPQVLEYIHQGNKLEAIKQYRAETGADLATAKDAIESRRG